MYVRTFQNAHYGFPLFSDITANCRVNLLAGTIGRLNFCSMIPRSSSNVSICAASFEKQFSNYSEVPSVKLFAYLVSWSISDYKLSFASSMSKFISCSCLSSSATLWSGDWGSKLIWIRIGSVLCIVNVCMFVMKLWLFV